MKFVKIVLLVCISLIFFIAVGCSVSASAQNGGLFISEVVTSNSNSLIDPVLGKPDWIELTNTSLSQINLKGYTIAVSNSKKYIFPDVSLDPGKYLILYCIKAPDGITTDKLCTGFKLPKSGVTLILSSPNGVIQELNVPSLETDISFGLSTAGKYAYFPVSTPGGPNTGGSFSDLKALESDKSAQLKINEILPKSSSSSDPYGWAEIYNAGGTAIELSDYYITENLSNPTKARLPEKQLAAGGYAVIRFTGEAGADTVPFKIGSSETSVAVSNNFGSVLDTISWDANILPGISAGHGENGAALYFITPSPGAKNSENGMDSISLSEGTSDVRINEILLRNTFSIIDADGDRSPWVELYNSSQNTVSLTGYALSDNKNNLLKWRFPNVELNPDSYMIVFLSGKDRISGTELHTNFKPGNTDSQLSLTNLNKVIVQTVGIPAERQDNISLGLSSDGQWLFYPQPTPSAPNDTKGFTKIDSTGTITAGLKINEVVSVSAAKAGKPDWVEIYNETSANVNLKGYYLSDTDSNLKKWPLGSANVKANGYAVIDKYQTESGTAPLSIPLSGKTLYLSCPEGAVLDQFDTGVLRPGVSSGLTLDGAQTMFQTPTPGAQNSGNTVQSYCSEPVFSAGGGHKTAPVSLNMSTATEGAQIYYTLDGSMPSKSCAKYTGPITISSNETVRAISAADGKFDSNQTVATYLFDDPHSLPLICLSMTQSDLNYVFSSPDRFHRYERAGYVEYYEADGTLGVRFPAGFRISGAGTRLYAQRSINLYLRGAYGESFVTYPFFDNYGITNFSSLSLRNMGQDNSFTRIRDAYFQMVVNGMNIDNMQSKFAVVYINGKYWGLYEFKENQNDNYLAAKHNINPDNVELARSNTYTYQGSNVNIKNLFTLAKRNTADPDVFKQYTDLADSDYFMDYLIAQTYFQNSDMYNQKYAHTTDNLLKWRPLLYDMDYGFRSCTPQASILGKFFNPVGVAHGVMKPDGTFSMTDTSLFYAFYKNAQWRDQFVKRYAQVLNTVLSTDNMLSLYDSMVASVKDEMPRTIARWGSPSSMKNWNSAVANLRRCIEQRRKYAISSLQSFFKVSDAQMKELFPNG